MTGYLITLERSQLRTHGLAELDLIDVMINDVAPAHESVGRDLLARLAEHQLNGAAIEDGITWQEGYWDIVIQRRSEHACEVFEWNLDRSIRIPGIAITATYELEQKAFCQAVGATFTPPMATQMIAISRGVLEREVPLEGIRYLSPPHMSGWYLTTPSYNGNIDSLRVEHAYHVTAQRPEIAKLLALPAGYWFILDEDREEVGFDASVAMEFP